MPIYEYACSSCGHQFELFVRSAAAANEGACPACHSQRIDKRFSTFACCSQTNGGYASANSAPACSGPV
jgi:putative FmdB family regulatory protein